MSRKRWIYAIFALLAIYVLIVASCVLYVGGPLAPSETGTMEPAPVAMVSSLTPTPQGPARPTCQVGGGPEC